MQAGIEREFPVELLDTFSANILVTDPLKTMSLDLFNLKYQAACPAWHVDARSPAGLNSPATFDIIRGVHERAVLLPLAANGVDFELPALPDPQSVTRDTIGAAEASGHFLATSDAKVRADRESPCLGEVRIAALPPRDVLDGAAKLGLSPAKHCTNGDTVKQKWTFTHGAPQCEQRWPQ